MATAKKNAVGVSDLAHTARLVPTVNAAQIEAMSRYLIEWAGDPDDEWSGVWREAVTEALRAAGLTVADEGRADA
jgi:ABC-type branched-subunit amino acid transport system substrate-binding protein